MKLYLLYSVVLMRMKTTMNKFVQFIKWCGRKIWKHTSSFILWTPNALYRFFKYLKAELGENTFITMALWELAFVCLALISTAGGFIFETKTNTSMPLAYISKMEMLSGVVLLAILGICCVYDMFEEEQEEIISRLKK